MEVGTMVNTMGGLRDLVAARIRTQDYVGAQGLVEDYIARLDKVIEEATTKRIFLAKLINNLEAIEQIDRNLRELVDLTW